MKVMLVVTAILLGVVVGYCVNDIEQVEPEVRHIEVMKLEVPNVIPKSSANRFFWGGMDIVTIGGTNHWVVEWLDPITGRYQLAYDPQNPARCIAISFHPNGGVPKMLWKHPDFDYMKVTPHLGEIQPLEESGA